MRRGKPYSIDLRERVVAAVEKGGLSARQAAAQFGVGASTAIRWVERVRETGIPPSFDEMKDALDLRSKSGIHRLITALEERGFIRRLANRARAIEVIKLPESVNHGLGRSRGFTPSVIEGDLGRVRQVSEDDNNGRPIAVPVMGRIAAGTPIEAIQQRSHTINMPPDLLSAGEHFALDHYLRIGYGLLAEDLTAALGRVRRVLEKAPA